MRLLGVEFLHRACEGTGLGSVSRLRAALRAFLMQWTPFLPSHYPINSLHTPSVQEVGAKSLLGGG